MKDDDGFDADAGRSRRRVLRALGERHVRTVVVRAPRLVNVVPV